MYRRVIQYIVASIGLIVCLLAIWTIGRAGLSRLLTEYVMRTSLMTPEDRINATAIADAAVRLTPSDPAAHRARAVALMDAERFDEGVREYERAVALRPGHYVLWLELGRARDRADDQQGALAAFSEAVRLAPYYAQPRWQRGNVLFRMGQREDEIGRAHV